MHPTLRSSLLLALTLASAACYTTKIRTRAGGAIKYEHRQWFLIGGMIPLSPDAGGECPDGVGSSESELSGTDFLIQIGLNITGLALAGSQCDAASESYSACVSGWMLLPNLFGTRTVTYTCVGR